MDSMPSVYRIHFQEFLDKFNNNLNGDKVSDDDDDDFF